MIASLNNGTHAGNLTTLRDEPKKAGIDFRTELLKARDALTSLLLRLLPRLTVLLRVCSGTLSTTAPI
jgi:hypothetical protein